jgi:hypothetical protein
MSAVIKKDEIINKNSLADKKNERELELEKEKLELEKQKLELEKTRMRYSKIWGNVFKILLTGISMLGVYLGLSK